MIQAYAGEFTVSPIPLELSMNYCSHKCAYCFANLNQPGRTLDVNKVINQIKGCKDSTTLTGYLLANGYPVLISNRVDPFAETNWRQTLSFIEMLQANGNRVTFQTKGGKGVDDALQLLDGPTHWYISISFWDDDLRKKIEPGAPSIGDRIKLIEQLKTEGHHVSVGINPIVEEWLPAYDFDSLIHALDEVGVEDYWLEMLHLNHKQIANMSDKELVNIGEDVINDAKKRNIDQTYKVYCHSQLRNYGHTVYASGQPYPSKYMSYYSELGLKGIKTNQEFVNYCFEKYPNGGEIKFGEYYEFMKEGFYEMPFSEADGYAYRVARNVYKKHVDQPIKTLKDVLAFYWDNPHEVSRSIGSNGLFSVLSYVENQEIMEFLCNEDGKIILYFDPKHQNNYRHFI